MPAVRGGGGGDARRKVTAIAHKFPGSGGAPPPKKPKDPARDSPSDPGHGTPPVSGGGTGGSYGGPHGGNYGHKSSDHPGQVFNGIPWVIRRQQALQRAGYRVGVDGIWGPRSQAAWAAFTAIAGANRRLGRGGNPVVPPGMSVYKGMLVTTAAARAARAVDDARQNAVGKNIQAQTRAFLAARNAARAGAVNAGTTGEDVRFGATPQERRHSIRQFEKHQGNRLAHEDYQRAITDTIGRVFGPDGFKTLAGNRKIALAIGRQHADAHDIALLLDAGYLNNQAPEDVRFVQHVVGAKETGVFDTQTADTIERKMAAEAAKAELDKIHAIKQRYYADGFGQLATYEQYGRVLSPAELYHHLTIRDPKAVRTSVYLGQLYENSQKPVDLAIQQVAQNTWQARNPGTPHTAPFTAAEVSSLLGSKFENALRAHNLTDFWARMGAAYDLARLEAQHREHNSSPGFWGSALGLLENAANWSGRQGAHALTFAGLMFHAPTTSTATGGDYYSPDEAWRQGWINLSELEERHPWQALALEVAADPLNLVGTGIFKGTAVAGGRLFIEYSGRGFAATAYGTRLYEASPELARILHGTFSAAMESEHIVNDLSLLGSYARQSFDMTRLGRYYAKATTFKQIALERVSSEIATHVVNSFRKAGHFVPVSAEAQGAGAAAERLAAHIGEAERAAIKKAAKGKGIGEAGLPAELRADLDRQYRELSAAFLEWAPGAKDAVREARASLYRDINRTNGRLSQYGKWLAAFIKEHHSRTVLARTARELATDTETGLIDEKKLNGYLASLGTYAAGHPHLDLAEIWETADKAFDRILYEQILPALDDYARAHLNELAWDSDGYLINEGDEAARAVLEDAMGFRFKDAFGAGKKVRVPNPNHLIRVTPDVADRMRATEFRRREQAIIRWAEDAKWNARPGAGADAKGATRVFHGTASDFLEFGPDHVASWNALGPGHYLSTSKDEAAYYAKEYAKGGRPERVIERRIRPGTKLLDLSGGINGGFVNDLSDALGLERGELWKAWQEEWKAVRPHVAAEGRTDAEASVVFWAWMTEKLDWTPEELRAAIEGMGYAGIKHTHRFEEELPANVNYVLFDPAKSLTAPPLKAADPAALRRIDHKVAELTKKLNDELDDAWKKDPETGRFYDSRRYLRVPKPYSRGYYRELGAGATSGHALAFRYEGETDHFVQMWSPENVVTDIAIEGQRVKVSVTQGLDHLADAAVAEDVYTAAARWAHARTGPGATLRVFGSNGHVPSEAAKEAWKAILDDPPFGWESTDGALIRPLPKHTKGRIDGNIEDIDPREQAILNLHAPSPLARDIQGLVNEFIGGETGELAALAMEHRKTIEAAKSAISSGVYARHGLLLQAAHYHQELYVRALYYTLNFGLSAWKFATLPLRPGYVVRNVIDNFAKMLRRGFRDPRLLFNNEGKSLLELAQYHILIRAARGFDLIFHTHVAESLDRLMQHFLAQHPEMIRTLVGEHGIPIPAELYEDRTLRVLDQDAFELSLDSRNLTRPERYFARRARLRGTPEASRWQRFQDGIWALMGSRPENYSKRIQYISTYKRVLRETGDEGKAFDAAIQDVEHTLFNFDAKHVTVLEDQLKVLFPFIGFWRKTARFWGTDIINSPRFYVASYKGYDVHDELNADLPAWMRRYYRATPLAGVVDLPGLGWLADFFRDSFNDPITLVSIGSFYRAFKSQNANLPDDQLGHSFLAPFERAVNDWGLGINPFWRTAGSMVGVFDRRTWQSIFPETGMIQGLTSMAGLTDVNVEQYLEDQVIQQLDLDIQTNAELSQQSFEHYVQMEMAGQAARGEPVDRAAAEAKLRKWLGLQQVVGFVTGVYFRHLTDTDIHLYTLQNEMATAGSEADVSRIWGALTPAEQEGYRLFKMAEHHTDPARFDHQRVALEAARTFYQLDTYEEQQAYAQQHPEILSIIHPDLAKGEGNAAAFVRTQLLLSQTDTVIQILNDFDDPAFNPKVGSAAYEAFVTPDLKAFWRQNDTPADRRQRHVSGLINRHMTRVQDAYFAIPQTDYDARASYLQAHPELSYWWNRNNTASDDYRAILMSANNTFREVYFRFVEAGDWNGADAYLKRHPFIFDFTRSEGRVTPDGGWRPRTEAQADYAKVAPLLRQYYTLNGADAATYLKANPLITWYWNKWGETGTDIYGAPNPGALPGYGYHPGGITQHAKDYLAVKPLLDIYFTLDDAAKQRFLDQHPEVRAYFAKYADERSTANFARSGGDLGISEILADNPEIADRYRFWIEFYKLPPDQRPGFIHRHAEEAGIFIYGSLGFEYQLREQARWHREAIATGRSERSVVYLHIKPLMDVYFTLKGAQKQLFLQMNPELGYYFDHFAKHDAIPADIAPVLEQYFHLPPYSQQRRDFIAAHPELTAYFGRDDSPTEKAMQSLVERYFDLPFGAKREEFVAKHPELGAYFDERSRQHDLYSNLAAAFNEADPRMQKYYEMYADIVPLDALKQFQLGLHHRGARPIYQAATEPGRQPDDQATVGARRDRSPA